MKSLASAVLLSLVIAAAVVPAIILEKTGQIEPTAPVSLAAQQAVRRIASLPVRFEPAAPAAGHESGFVGRGFGYTIFLTPGGATVSPEKTTAKPFRMQLVGGNVQATGAGAGALAGASNYLLGADRKAWRTGVPNYSAVRYTGVYQGVDLLYYGKQRELEYDFIVAPRARPEVIGLRFDGVRSIELTSAGDLQLRGDGRDAVLRKPVAYQENNGARTEVACRFALRDSGEVGFEIGDYDASRPLVIDPVLNYSTFLGGTLDDDATSIAIDASGNIYVTGFTTSSNFPVTGGVFQSQKAANRDIFVVKLNAAGNSRVYSTFIGGAADDLGYSIAVDGSGNAYITGETFSSDFPTTAGVLQSSWGQSADAFVAKLNSSGNALAYATFLGGNGTDAGQGIAVNAAGEAYVVGSTTSSSFPTANAFQSILQGAKDAFVIKLSAAGNSALFGTFLGGGGQEEASDLALDSSGNVYLAGLTTSTDFDRSNAAQNSYGGGPADVFVTKLSSSGLMSYSTYLGGSGDEAANGIDIDASGNAYVTGYTISQNFPTVSALQGSFGGSADAFVTKVSSAGNSFVYSTYLGGSGIDNGIDIAVNSTGQANVAGSTASSNFPLSAAFQASLGGGSRDGFVALVAANGNSLVYSSFLGGAGLDEAFAITVNGSGSAFVAGITDSGNFSTIGAVQTSLAGAVDGFVARVEPTAGGGAVPFSVSVTPNSMTVNRGQSAAYTVNVASVGGAFNSAVNLGCGSLPTATSCTFTPASVTPGVVGATATLSIRTTAPAAIPPSRPMGPQSPLPMIFVLLTIMTLALLAAWTQRRQLQWRFAPTAALLFVVALALGVQVSCGGGGGGSGGGGGGGGQASTAPGTYTVAVSGTSGAMQASTNVTLVVQ